MLGHNLLDLVEVPAWGGPGSPPPPGLARLWMLVHQGGRFPLLSGPDLAVHARYPALPWVGVMACGYAAAELFLLEGAHRRHVLRVAAAAMLAAFVVLRLTQAYGDPIAWSVRPTAARTAMAFLDVQKYGPSLQFLLATLPWPCLLLAWLEGRELGVGALGGLVTFGRVPLFYYLLQWPVAYLGGWALEGLLGFSPTPADVEPVLVPGRPGSAGLLAGMYLTWLAGLALLYWPCRWYAGVKGRRKDLALLRYL